MTHQYRGYDYDVNVCDANGGVDVCQTLVQYRTKMLELEQLYIRFLPNHFHPDGRPEIKVCCKGIGCIVSENAMFLQQRYNGLVFFVC